MSKITQRDFLVLKRSICRLTLSNSYLTLSNGYQLYLEDERRIARNITSRTIAIAHLTGNINQPVIANMHIDQCYLKATDELVDTECLRTTSDKGIIEYLAAYERALIVASHNATRPYVSLTISTLQHLVKHSTPQLLYAILITNVCQKLLILLLVYLLF